MKKFIILSIGFSLFGAGLIMPFSEASRDAYHVYMNADENFYDYRHFTEGQATDNSLRTEGESQRAKISEYKQARRYRGSRENFFTGNRSITDDTRMLRHSTDRIAPNTKRTIRTHAQSTVNLTARAVAQVQASLYTFENDKFSLLLPVGWTLADETADIHVYENVNSSFSLRVKHFMPETCGTSAGFMSCGIRLSRAENYLAVGSAGKLEIVSKIVRDSRTDSTILNQIGVMTNTYTEQFTALFPFFGEKTVARYFVAAPDGGIFMVEASAAYRESGIYTEVTKRVFDSFRIYPTE